jgi:2-polyprenyl-3-methyl-5-hydroxy-6-metoxy-1,4-benzoquinol methylase
MDILFQIKSNQKREWSRRGNELVWFDDSCASRVKVHDVSDDAQIFHQAIWDKKTSFGSFQIAVIGARQVRAFHDARIGQSPRILSTSICQDGPILEFGCGHGDLRRKMHRERMIHVAVGCDVSTQRWTIVRFLNPQQGIDADDESDQQGNAIQDLARILRLGGWSVFAGNYY